MPLSTVSTYFSGGYVFLSTAGTHFNGIVREIKPWSGISQTAQVSQWASSA